MPFRSYWFLLAAAAAACTPAPEIPASLDLTKAQVVDLSYPLDEQTLYWPSSPRGFKLEKLSYGPTPAGYFYAAYTFSAPEHGGTHIDAPIHFGEGRRTVDQIPLRQLVAPAVVIDVSA